VGARAIAAHPARHRPGDTKRVKATAERFARSRFLERVTLGSAASSRWASRSQPRASRSCPRSSANDGGPSISVHSPPSPRASTSSRHSLPIRGPARSRAAPRTSATTARSETCRAHDHLEPVHARRLPHAAERTGVSAAAASRAWSERRGRARPGSAVGVRLPLPRQPVRQRGQRTAGPARARSIATSSRSATGAFRSATCTERQPRRRNRRAGPLTASAQASGEPATSTGRRAKGARCGSRTGSDRARAAPGRGGGCPRCRTGCRGRGSRTPTAEPGRARPRRSLHARLRRCCGNTGPFGCVGQPTCVPPARDDREARHVSERAVVADVRGAARDLAGPAIGKECRDDVLALGKAESGPRSTGRVVGRGARAGSRSPRWERDAQRDEAAEPERHALEEAAAREALRRRFTLSCHRGRCLAGCAAIAAHPRCSGDERDSAAERCDHPRADDEPDEEDAMPIAVPAGQMPARAGGGDCDFAASDADRPRDRARGRRCRRRGRCRPRAAGST